MIAILLVTSSRPGPKLVFHYPPHLQQRSYWQAAIKDGTDSEDDSDNDFDTPRRPSFAPTSPRRKPDTSPRSANNSRRTHGQTGLDGILGFSEDGLAKLLSPGCWCDRKKFEISVGRLTFVGHPMHADHDGSWARKHTHSSTASKLAREPTTPPWSATKATGADIEAQLSIEVTESTPVRDFAHVPESFESHGGTSLATSMNSASSTSAVSSDHLTSFHVVFVLVPPASENTKQYTLSVYQHVAKKLSKALYHCQRQMKYVDIESRKMLSLKMKVKQEAMSLDALTEKMIENSELAWALKEVYEHIAVDSTAGFRLNGTEMSLQMPTQTDTARPESTLDRNAGLLLLEDKDVLLRELSHPDASPLAFFIREHTPTKSLQKQADSLSMAIGDVLYLARHLVKWRKARPIAPLHPRNTYIVGPYAPFEKVKELIPKYARKFSALPSLPQVLKVMSGRPIKYGILIPSRDHREPYLDILAFLVQHRFVDQLKTFGWLQAPNELKKVRIEQDANMNRRPVSVASLLSPQLRPADDDNISISSERTAIPIDAVGNERRPGLGTTSGASSSLEAGLDSSVPKMIVEPLTSSEGDAQRLENIRNVIDDYELRDRLPSLLHYFNGETALEDMAGSEGLKRSKVEAWLEVLERSGSLLTFRRL